MSKRSADVRGDGKHRGDAGHDRDIERAPGFRACIDFLAHSGSHRKHAGIAARHDGDAGAFGGMSQRRSGACAFLAVVRGVAASDPAARCDAIEIGAVAVKRIGRGERSVRLGREPARIAGAKADHGEPPAHGRSSQPGTSTTAK